MGGTVVLLGHDGVTVSGFTIQSTGGYTAGTTRGVHLLNVGGCTVSDCIFTLIGKGVWLYNSSGNTIEGNSVEGARYFTWSAVTMQYSSNNKIFNNTVTASEQGAIEVFNSNGNSITGNYVKSQWYGLNIGGSDSNVIEDNSICWPKMRNTARNLFVQYNQK